MEKEEEEEEEEEEEKEGEEEAKGKEGRRAVVAGAGGAFQPPPRATLFSSFFLFFILFFFSSFSSASFWSVGGTVGGGSAGRPRWRSASAAFQAGPGKSLANRRVGNRWRTAGPPLAHRWRTAGEPLANKGPTGRGRRVECARGSRTADREPAPDRARPATNCWPSRWCGWQRCRLFSVNFVRLSLRQRSTLCL